MLTADGCAQVVRKRKALKVAKMWINKALGRAWNSWIECVSEIKRLKAVANRVVKRWIHRALAEALEKWNHEVIEPSILELGEKSGTIWGHWAPI